MWIYEKRLQYPVNITKTDARIAKIIATQYGGPDGEIGASMRYLSQQSCVVWNKGFALSQTFKQNVET